MSRKPIHVEVDLPWRKRLRWVFAGGRIHILLQPTTLGSVKVVDVIIGKQSNKPEVRHGDS